MEKYISSKRATSLLNGTHKISHAPGFMTETIICQEPGSDLPADLEISGEVGSNCNLPQRQLVFFILQLFFPPQLYLAVLVLHCYTRAFSSCGEWGLLYTCSVWGFSLLVVSLVSEHGLFQSTQTSVNVTRGLSCSMVCGILVPRPEIEPASPALQGGFLATGPPGKSLISCSNSWAANHSASPSCTF